MNEVKKCPKCNGEVQKGNLFTPRNGGTVIKFTDRESESLWILGNAKKVHALACKSCGYVENYKEMNKP